MFFNFRKNKEKNLHITATLTPEIKIEDIRQAVSDEVKRSLEKLVSKRVVKDLSVRKIIEGLEEKAIKEQLCLKEHRKKSLANKSKFVQKREIGADFEAQVRAENQATLELAAVSSGLSSESLSEYFEPLVTAMIAKGGHLYRDSTSTHTIITEALKLSHIMFEISRSSTYLNEDYTGKAVTLAILLTAFSHDLGALCEEHSIRLQLDRKSEPFNIFTDDLIKLSKAGKDFTVCSQSKRSAMSLEHTLVYGMNLLQPCTLKFLEAISNEKAQKLVHEIIKPDFGGRLINLLVRAKELLRKGESVAECEFIESVRPEFVGVAHTPEDWFLDPRLSELPYFYPDSVMSRVKLSKSIVFYVNHSYEALDRFLFSYKEYKDKKEKEARESLSFINGSKLLKAAADIDYKNRETIRETGKGEPDEYRENADGTLHANSCYQKGSLEELMLSDAAGVHSDKDKVILSDSSNDNSKTHKSRDRQIMEALMQTQSCINRYCYSHRINRLQDVRQSDPRHLAMYKKLGTLVIEGKVTDTAVVMALESRTVRMRHLIDVVTGFYKDGRFNTDLQLEAAVSNAQNFKDYFLLILALLDSAIRDPENNQLGLDYINHFIEGELVGLSRLLGANGQQVS